MAGSISDVDARRRVEDALRESDKRYERVMLAAEAGFWDWDVPADKFYVSPKLVEMTDFPPGTEFAGRADFMARAPFHPDDRIMWERAVKELFTRGGTRLTGELRTIHGAETRWYVLSGMCVRDPAGKVQRWTGSATYITEEKRVKEALRLSEERYALAMETSEEGHFDWNMKTDEIFASERLKQVLDLPAGVEHRTWSEMAAHIPFYPGDRERIGQLTRDVRAENALHTGFEYRLLRGQARELRWIRARWKIFRDENGAAQRMIGVVSDVTELRKMEQELRGAQRLEAMGTLAGGIAHDFNNILGAIVGYGEMALRDAKQGTRLRRDVESIMAAGERGRALVDRILAFSRSGVGERVPVHVEAVVREVLDQLAAKLPENVTLAPHLRAGRAAMLGDSTQVHQVVMNLTNNGVQAMPNGGVLRVALETAEFDATRPVAVGSIVPGEYIELRVSDTGTGIPHDVLEHMFDPFFTTKEAGVGTGLGLSLVHGIVTNAGGAIDVATELGKGTTFVVYLRRTGIAPEKQADEGRPLPRGGGQRVLVVDDEEPLVRLATETLEHLGYAPVGFTSSTAALAAFHAEPQQFDAVLTDERMPGLSGSALIREVRRVSPSIPIVLMSGFVGAAAAASARELGADDVLRKPLRARDLATSLAGVLHT
jgi:signal transduction histidine kinase